MGPRYPGGPRPGSVRMPQMGPEFGGVISKWKQIKFGFQLINDPLIFLFSLLASR